MSRNIVLASHICLTGMVGVGKTWVGEELAKRIERRWIDLDDWIEESSGSEIHTIFTSQGESHFRSIEAEHLRKALKIEEPTVISLGGGSVLDPESRKLLAQYSLVVYLRAKHSTLLEYLRDDKPRPLLRGDLSEKIDELLLNRDPIYRDVSDLVIDTDGKDAVAISEEVIQFLTEARAFPQALGSERLSG